MLLLRDANAGVPDPDAEEYLVGNDRDGNLALFCILYGVVDKVADSFRSPFFIEYGGQIIQAFRFRDGQSEPLFFRRMGVLGGEIFQHRENGGFLRRQSEDSCLQTGKFYQRDNQKFQLFCLNGESGDILSRFLREILLGQQFGIQKNVGDRSLRLMGDIGDQCLYFVFFHRRVFEGSLGRGQIFRKTAFQGGKPAFVKGMF